MTKFKEEWLDFVANVIPPTAGRVQVNEMKKAFYSGALALVSLQCRIFSEGTEEVTGQDMSNYDNLVNEIVSVCKSFAREGKHRHETN